MKQIIFFASLWGFLEATFGWLFHFIHVPAGAVMFPVGMLLLLAGYTIRQERSTLLLIGVIAALIKLSNLLLPGSEFLFKPTISILIETLLVAIIAPYIQINWVEMKINFLRKEVSYGISLSMLTLAIGAQICVI